MRLWTDADNQRLVDDFYPELAAQYASCPHGIQRADIARCLILHRYGGVYADLDVEALRPIDPLIEGRACVLTLEPALHAAWSGESHLVSNAFMAAAPRHPLFDLVIDLLGRRDMHAASASDVLATTGPILLKEAVARYEGTDVVMLPAEAFSPLVSSSDELERLREQADAGEAIRQRCLDAGAWGIHYWANTWARTLAGTLSNDDPDGVPGYVFERGMDSPGGDVQNAGADVRRLAAICEAHPLAAGFNTDGFVKAFIRTPALWVSLPYARPNEGLYVRRAFHFGGRRERRVTEETGS